MPSMDGDFNFVGDWSTTANPYQDRQALINWFVEIDPSKAAKTPVALLGTPGLLEVASVADAT